MRVLEVRSSTLRTRLRLGDTIYSSSLNVPWRRNMASTRYSKTPTSRLLENAWSKKKAWEALCHEPKKGQKDSKLYTNLQMRKNNVMISSSKKTIPKVSVKIPLGTRPASRTTKIRRKRDYRTRSSRRFRDQNDVLSTEFLVRPK